MSKYKKLPFVFELPVTSLGKNKGLFSSIKIGDLQICGEGKVIAAPENDYPYALQSAEGKKWVEITITEVYWRRPEKMADVETNITLLLRHMKECRELNGAILAAAFNQCISIYQEKYAQ